MNKIIFAFRRLFNREEVTSVEEMALTERGMRGGTVYKIKVNGTQTELMRYREGRFEPELEESATCDTQYIIELMNSCGIIGWDGFSGKHPRNVHDGIMFKFKATVNGGRSVKANGSENFPKGYRELLNGINSIFSQRQ